MRKQRGRGSKAIHTRVREMRYIFSSTSSAVRLPDPGSSQLHLRRNRRNRERAVDRTVREEGEGCLRVEMKS